MNLSWITNYYSNYDSNNTQDVGKDFLLNQSGLYFKLGDKGRGGYRTAATSKMELFLIIVNGWKPLTIITKSSILNVAADLDPPLKGIFRVNELDKYDVNKMCSTIRQLLRYLSKLLMKCLAHKMPESCYFLGPKRNLRILVEHRSLSER